jgi:Uma2 family endonuclease
MTVAAPSPDVQERLRRISVDEYHRMIEAGILDEDEKVQLVDGMLVAMTPQGQPHAFVIMRLTRLLARALSDDFEVLPQLPLTLGADSEPEPDLAVVRAQDAASTRRHPRTALLVVEVAGDSLRFDRRTKLALYASSGIPEYWIVNLEDAVIEVFREPDAAAGSYRATAVARRGETLASAALPGVGVAVALLFPEEQE